MVHKATAKFYHKGSAKNGTCPRKIDFFLILHRCGNPKAGPHHPSSGVAEPTRWGLALS